MKNQEIPNRWRKIPLKELFEVKNGKTDVVDAVEDGKYPLFDRSDEIKKSNKYLFDCEAIILPGEGKDFTPKYYSGMFDLHQRAYAIFSKSNQVNTKFFFYAINVSKKTLWLHAVGSTVKSLRLPIIQNLELLVPEKKEQDKIADILTTADENIEETNQIIVKYLRLKKSMLRKLLTKGFNVKKFKKVEYRKQKFQEIPEHWEWTTLGERTRPESGSTPSKSIPKYYTGSIPWITTVDLNYGLITKPTEYITEEAVKSAHLTIHPKGTFLIAITGLEAARTRGRCGILGIEATTSQSCVAFEPDKNVLPEFLFYWYQCFSHSIIFQLAQGTKQQSLNINLVREISIALPPIDEQKKIIEIMKQLDRTLQVNKEKKKLAVELKKSLMQKLLSGEIRVKV